MARTKQTQKTSEQTIMTTTPVELSVPMQEPEVKTTKAKKSKKQSTGDVTLSSSVENVVLEQPPVEVSSSVESTTAVDDSLVVSETEVSLINQSDEFFKKLQELGVTISSLKSEYRILEKKWSRELKVALKLNSKRKRKSGNRAPSGFVKPTKISEELADFLGKEHGTEMARTAVTRDINAYIRSNQLQDKDNGRKINPDAKLASLLKLKNTDELTYFNLQKYMSPHFHKNVKVDSVVQTQQSVSL